MPPTMNEGYQRLWNWFGLSYASFIVVPRIMAHSMPDDWQARMAQLLEEYENTFNCPAGETSIRASKNGKLCKMPQWILNYRHPDKTEIEKCRRKP